MSEDFFKKIYLSLYLKGCVWEGVGDQTELQHIDPHSYGHQCSVFLVLQGCSTRGPGTPSAGCWLPLQHLVTNRSGLQTNWLPVFTELYNSSIAHSISPHNWPSEMCHFCCLWNGMFDCHRAEITVMLFTGYSLPVHQSMTVPWDFTLSHIVSQAVFYIIVNQ